MGNNLTIFWKEFMVFFQNATNQMIWFWAFDTLHSSLTAQSETSKSRPFTKSDISDLQDYSSDVCCWEGCGPDRKNVAPGSWFCTQRQANQYISEGKLFFVFSQTTAATFQPITSLTKQMSIGWQQGLCLVFCFFSLGNSAGEWAVTPWQSLNHRPTRSTAYSEVWDIHSSGWGNGCSHPAFQKQRKPDEKHTPFSCFHKNALFTSQNVFCDITGPAIQTTPGDWGDPRAEK